MRSTGPNNRFALKILLIYSNTKLLDPTIIAHWNDSNSVKQIYVNCGEMICMSYFLLYRSWDSFNCIYVFISNINEYKDSGYDMNFSSSILMVGLARFFIRHMWNDRLVTYIWIIQDLNKSN